MDPPVRVEPRVHETQFHKTVLSVILAHFNVAIVPKETRYLFTQYAAGSLFQWVEHGIQKSKDFYTSLSEEGQEEQQLKDAVRWEFSLSLSPSASS